MTLINLIPGMAFGQGIDGLTEQRRAPAIAFDGETDNSGGAIVDSRMTIIESQDSLMEALDLSVSASVRYGFVEGDAKFELAQERTINTYSSYVLMKVIVRNPPRSMVNPRLTPEAEELYKRDPEQFRQIYGDYYIDQIYGGGEFFGLFSFEAKDEAAHDTIKADLSVSLGSFFAGGKLTASFENMTKRASKHSRLEITALMSGGRGLLNPENLEDLRELYRNFNRAVDSHPIDYKVNVTEYKYLPLPAGQSWAEEVHRNDVIRQCGSMIVDGIKQRANIAFILRYPNQFDLLDGSLDALKKNYDTIQATLPKLAVIARDCAEELEKCDMTGISPFAVELPQRLATANIDPIEEKWWSLERDERALPSFEREPVPDFLAWFNGPRGGRYKLFYNENREIVSGIFWCLEHGACAVYGEIMREYVRRGHCNGPLGYPKTDELAGDDGVGRVSWFENDALWWTPERGVGDGLPPFLRVTPWPRPTPLPPIGI